MKITKSCFIQLTGATSRKRGVRMVEQFNINGQEFFVMKKYRKMGVGRIAAINLFENIKKRGNYLS